MMLNVKRAERCNMEGASGGVPPSGRDKGAEK